MDKDIERAFLDTIAKALVSLPFDLKSLARGGCGLGSRARVREVAAATVVHVITPKDGNVEAPLRFVEDVVQLRLALAEGRGRGRRGRAGVPRSASRRITPASTRS